MNKKIILLYQRVTSFVNRWHGFDINYRQNVERYSDICLHARITLLPKHSRIISQREWLRFSLSLTNCPLPLPRPQPPNPIQNQSNNLMKNTQWKLLLAFFLLSFCFLSFCWARTAAVSLCCHLKGREWNWYSSVTYLSNIYWGK